MQVLQSTDELTEDFLRIVFFHASIRFGLQVTVRGPSVYVLHN
jgi:hypothetical protein